MPEVWIEFYKDGGKYGYDAQEKFFMFIFSTLTNLTCIPAIIMLWKRDMIFQVFVSAFTFLTSFMYHFQDSIAAQRILLSELEWHKLDNIGSIMCFIILFVNWADIQCVKQEQIIHFSALFFTLLLQEADTWNIAYTVFPILFFGFLLFILYLKRSQDEKRKSQVNNKMIKYGILTLGSAIYFFYKGLDEYKDYLRFYHGIWHFLVGVSSMYTWQIRYCSQEEFTFSNVLNYEIKQNQYKQIEQTSIDKKNEVI